MTIDAIGELGVLEDRLESSSRQGGAHVCHGRRRLATLTGVLVAAGSLAAGGLATGPAAAAAPRSGGRITVLEPSADAWPTGLDPVTSATATISQSEMNAIYGELFELGPNGSTIYDLAKGSSLTDGRKRFTIYLRPGVRFSDGTAFSAAAVAYSLNQDLHQASPLGRPPFPVGSITTPNSHTVVMNLISPDGAILNQFQDSIANWVVDPTAIKKMGAQRYAMTPVGAGPFVVVRDTPPDALVLRRNPHYWQKGHPYLSGLTFEVTESDQTALEAMQAGDAQAYEGMLTANLVPVFEHAGMTVTPEPSSTVYDLQLNSTAAPLVRLDARRALYEATDSAVLAKVLFNGATKPDESFTTPGSRFYLPRVVGYPTYDLAKARALVKKLGGLTVNLLTVVSSVNTAFAEALQKMWEQAGIKVTISVDELTAVIQDVESGKWQVILSTAGAFDPAAGVGLAFHFETPSSGVHSPHLDTLINDAQAVQNTTLRKRLYAEIGKFLADGAYNPFLFPVPTWNIASRGVQGPGLTTRLPTVQLSPSILWEDVSAS